MKTSNKLLICGSLFITLLFLVFNLYSRKYLVESENLIISESGVEVQKVLLENYETDTLYLKSYFNYELDPNSTSVTVKCDENTLPIFNVKNYRGLCPGHRNKNDVHFSFPATFTIGVKGKSNLVIIAKDRAKIWSKAQLNIQNLTIKANNNSVIDIDNNGKKLNIYARNNSNFDLEGNIENALISCEYRSRIDAMNINFDSLNIALSERAFLRVKNANMLTGELEDDAIFETIEDSNISKLKFYDNAKHKIESWD